MTCFNSHIIIDETFVTEALARGQIIHAESERIGVIMTVKNKSKIVAIITALFISIAFMPVSTGATYANTTDEIDNENSVVDSADVSDDDQESISDKGEDSADIVYEKLDDTYHCYTDSNGEVIQEEHNWNRTSSCIYVDDDTHHIAFKCDKCGATKYEEERHDYEELPSKWSKTEYGQYIYKPDFKCKCGAESDCSDDWFYGGHDWDNSIDYYWGKDFDPVEYNSTYHLLVDGECKNCGAVYGEDLERHDFYSEYSKINSKYHIVDRFCLKCYFSSSTKAKHKKSSTKVLKKATFKKKGKIQDVCACGYVLKTKTVPWKHNTKYSVSYDVTWNTNVYRNSKSITVTLKNPAKGATVFVKIGKKKYSKKAGKGKKVKIKIKKPKKYGQKIYISVKYKGKRIGTTATYGYDTVYYAKNIKKGMTKKQFRNTYNYWGTPDDTASGSGGWTYWYYDDGSYIGFKKGKIKFWYDAG